MRLALLLLLPVSLLAQGDPSHAIEFARVRIEHAFQSGAPASIEDLLTPLTMMRLGDSLYKGISPITSLQLLNGFFAEKDSISFRLTGRSLGSGTLTYTSGGSRDTVNVDIWLGGRMGQVSLFALNISNYPVATVFMDLHPYPERASPSPR